MMRALSALIHHPQFIRFARSEPQLIIVVIGLVQYLSERYPDRDIGVASSSPCVIYFEGTKSELDDVEEAYWIDRLDDAAGRVHLTAVPQSEETRSVSLCDVCNEDTITVVKTSSGWRASCDRHLYEVWGQDGEALDRTRTR